MRRTTDGVEGKPESIRLDGRGPENARGELLVNPKTSSLDGSLKERTMGIPAVSHAR